MRIGETLVSNKEEIKDKKHTWRMSKKKQNRKIESRNTLEVENVKRGKWWDWRWYRKKCDERWNKEEEQSVKKYLKNEWIWI